MVPEGRISPGDTGIWTDGHGEAAGRRSPGFMQGAGRGRGPTLSSRTRGARRATEVPWRGGAGIAPGAGGWTPLATEAPLSFERLLPDAGGARRTRDPLRDRRIRAGRAPRPCRDALRHRRDPRRARPTCCRPVPLAAREPPRRSLGAGSLENRMRLVARGGASGPCACGPSDKPLLVRISASDWPGGLGDLESAIELYRRLRQQGGRPRRLLPRSAPSARGDPLNGYIGYQVRVARGRSGVRPRDRHAALDSAWSSPATAAGPGKDTIAGGAGVVLLDPGGWPRPVRPRLAAEAASERIDLRAHGCSIHASRRSDTKAAVRRIYDVLDQRRVALP